jgi:hypothetical protein
VFARCSPVVRTVFARCSGLFVRCSYGVRPLFGPVRTVLVRCSYGARSLFLRLPVKYSEFGRIAVHTCYYKLITNLWGTAHIAVALLLLTKKWLSTHQKDSQSQEDEEGTERDARRKETETRSGYWGPSKVVLFVLRAGEQVGAQTMAFFLLCLFHGYMHGHKLP